MSSRAAYYFAAFVVILTHSMFFPVKGQQTIQVCENGDPTISIVADLGVEAIRQLNMQVQGIRELLTESLQDMKNQYDTVMTRLQAIDQRSQEQDIYIKQVQSIHELLNVSHQQMENHHDTVLRSLETFDRRFHGHEISSKNTTQTSWKLEIAFDMVLGEVPILLSTVNDWIVLMHRFDGSLNFNRNWTEYRNGFGDIGRGEFLLGNEKVHRLTNRFIYTLRIEVQLYTSGRWYYADYTTLSLDSEDSKYALRLSGFSGNAGDSLTNTSVEPIYYHGGMSFSTWDKDDDGSPAQNCAQADQGGWWFNRCGYSCLTCAYGNTFNWWSLSHLQPNGRLRAARMMIKSN